jgi:uncharacterized protein YcaQ
MTERLTLAQTRRIALAAQGFADPRPTGRVDRRHVRKVFDRIGVIQVDSVNVLVRSEELPLFARLGPHPRHLLREMDRDGELFEYWAHEAALVPSAKEPLFRWKKHNGLAGNDPTVWGGIRNFHLDRAEVTEAVLAEIAGRGPIAPSDLSTYGGQKRDGWGWHWNEAKVAVENLFWTGRIAAAYRGAGFERHYDLPERCFPAAVLAAPTPAEDDARKELLLQAARSHGIGTAKCLIDYHRQRPNAARALLDELVEEGKLLRVDVDGWAKGLYLDPGAKQPRRVSARALVSPFDSLVWERTRTEQLFNFLYRIEIYVPQEKRQYGYYVLPFLLGEELVGRVDLKADRKDGALLVQSSWGELGIDERHVAGELAEELALMAEWLELDRVVVKSKGSLARSLKAAIAAR